VSVDDRPPKPRTALRLSDWRTSGRVPPRARDRLNPPAATEPERIERLERLAIKHNLGNATLGREIIRKYLEQKADEEVPRAGAAYRHQSR
jgi:hypothetical protein